MDQERLQNLQEPLVTRKNRRRRRLFTLGATALLLAAAAGISFQWNTNSAPALQVTAEASLPSAADDAALPAEPIPADHSGKVQSGESFYDLMKMAGADDSQIWAMSEATRKTFNLRRLKAGRPYEIIISPEGKPAGFSYGVDDHQLLVIAPSAEGWSARLQPIEYDYHERAVEGVIQDSLYLSLSDACLSPALAVELADIFSWDIDFAVDLRKGDTFSILYQERRLGGRYEGIGRVLGARILNQGETYTAFYHEDESGEGDYFDAEGRSLQKQFLKSPLRFKYISSYFSKNRLHPVLKIRRPHLGVDYAAPYGTPVRAAADGRVVFKGRNGGMGNMIKIRHNAVYDTAYGHLSEYARGLEVGKTVRQGEIIAYVGSTGLSTGPHLHYSFFKNGVQINPIREANPRAKSLPPSELEHFKSTVEERLLRMDPPERQRITATLDPSGT